MQSNGPSTSPILSRLSTPVGAQDERIRRIMAPSFRRTPEPTQKRSSYCNTGSGIEQSNGPSTSPILSRLSTPVGAQDERIRRIMAQSFRRRPELLKVILLSQNAAFTEIVDSSLCWKDGGDSPTHFSFFKPLMPTHQPADVGPTIRSW